VAAKTVGLVLYLLLMVPAVPLAAWSQQVQIAPPGGRVSPDQNGSLFPDQRRSPEDEARSRMQEEMAKKANQQRQDQLKRDTEKLLKLATELKGYVDKSNENVLSVDVVKKAEEIEKLAHSVKDKMKGNN
jgi:membrane protein involved in colicin uptake